jgi:hypothetical protein
MDFVICHSIFVIRDSPFDKLHKAEVSFSIKPAVFLASGWADY